MAERRDHERHAEDREALRRLIRTRGNHVYFYSLVTNESCVELMMTIGKVKDAIVDAMVRVRTQDESYMDDLLLLGNGSNLEEKEPGRIDIYLHICSDGGHFSPATAAYDNLCALSLEGVRLITIAEGFCLSAATMLFVAGEIRYVMPTCLMLVHQLSSAVETSSYLEIKSECKNQELMLETLKAIYLRRTNLTKPVLKRFFAKDVMIGATEAIRYGIAHKEVGEGALSIRPETAAESSRSG